MLICTKIAKEEFDPSRKGTPLADRYLDLFFKELFWFLDVHSGIVRENIMKDENTDVNNEFYVASICSTYAFCLELKGVESAEEDMIKYLNARALRLSEKFEFTSCIVYAYLENTIIQEILQRAKITGVVGWAMEVIAMLIFEGHKPSLSYKPSLPPLLPFVQNYKTDDNVLLKIKAHVLEMAEK
ncbi:hypothetical protein CRE_09953 [Caenorhabditis remanei]|uniref:Uncharacterized protein n=1 Tax=Caenorhabditis remanei TaxID=31234 RepID=E3NW70_CAERE|nr:hypothetical protein CRE_09953 [Caenorhabditis remanei]